MRGLKDVSYKNLASDSDPMRKGLPTASLHRSRVLSSKGWTRGIIGSCPHLCSLLSVMAAFTSLLLNPRSTLSDPGRRNSKFVLHCVWGRTRVLQTQWLD